MIKPMNIINGWKNLFHGLETELAKARAEHCTGCEFAKVGTWEKMVDDIKITNIQGMKCQKCGCPLSAKLRSINEKCPINKW